MKGTEHSLCSHISLIILFFTIAEQTVMVCFIATYFFHRGVKQETDIYVCFAIKSKDAFMLLIYAFSYYTKYHHAELDLTE
jgi:hypothetical protein